MTEERTFPRANVREVSKLLCCSMIRVVSGEKKRLVKAAGAESHVVSGDIPNCSVVAKRIS